ncbi:DUF4488 domain-containing protein [Parapedobacter tibetensis]|uniref:DUF4488 domain-containing protein n=1 Tax=Parapedobacter tibetensis TaxID=2972951 RepID=UPI00214D5805|nr:DUF4488 domain-containing protein [Parapedobacter tibetensis]
MMTTSKIHTTTYWNKGVLLALMLFALPSMQSFSQGNRADLFVGVWELVGMANANTNGEVLKVPAGNYKIFGADGSYLFMQWTPQGSRYVQEGTFNVLTDSTYAEHIKHALNKNLEGNQYEITYRSAEDSTITIEGKIDGFSYRELWRKVMAEVLPPVSR